MKVCHVVPSLEEQHGGPSKSVQALCQGLARAGHEVELLTTDPNAPGNGVERRGHDNLTVRVFRRDWPTRLCPSRGLQRALRDTPAEIVHHHALWLRTLHYSRQGAERANAPLVVSPRGMMSQWALSHHGGRKRLAQWFVHPGAFEATAGWHATSQEEAQEVSHQGYRQPICVAPNGVSAPEPETMARSRQFWSELCPELVDRPVALFYGRFHRKKRIRELLESWARRPADDWLLLLAGLPEEYSVAELQQEARQLAVDARVRVIDGTGKPPPYAVASLFLLPSHNENFGLTIAEAMSHAVAVLVTDTTPWAGVNVEGCGWCVPWVQFETTLDRVLGAPREQLRVCGARARDWVLRSFSWDRSASDLAAFYRQLRQPARR